MNVGLYNAAAALRTNDRWQELIAENLASSSIPGYRKQELSFEAVRAGATAQAGNPPPTFALARGEKVVNFTPGEMKFTGAPTDVAIDGKAFFEVQLPNGSTAYTRDGEFQISGQGQLVTKQGFAVLSDGGPIQIDLERPEAISIASTGEISQGNDLKGRLKLTEFADPQLLTQISGGLFLASNPAIVSGPSQDSTVRQGWQEGANTSVVGEMASLLLAMRTFEANQRIVQLHDERISKSINALENT